MRTVHTLGMGLIGAFVAIGCGGSSSDNPPAGGTDAGNDATSGQGNGGSPGAGGSDAGAGDANASSPVDSGGGTGSDDAGACVIDADILTLSPADAALDDAGDSVGTCLACTQTSCATELTACNADCSCNQGFDCLAGCIGGVGNSILTCVAQCFPGGISGIESDPSELNVVECVNKSCNTQCSVGSILGGGGGKKDAGTAAQDAATDAPTDAPVDSATDG